MKGDTMTAIPNAKPPPGHYPVIVIGAGQAGLSMSYLLKERGINHVVFEKDRVAESWRTKRWDTFCLVTPNWQCRLPGFPYSGPDPQGFMVKDDIVSYIETYARTFAPPLHEGVGVSRLQRAESGGFELSTDIGAFTADQVVVATRMPRNSRQAMSLSSARANPGARLPRTCTSPDGGCISALAAPRGPPAATAARTSSIG